MAPWLPAYFDTSATPVLDWQSRSQCRPVWDPAHPIAVKGDGSAAAGGSACPRLPVLPAGTWQSLLGAAGAEPLPGTAPLGGQGTPRSTAILRLIPIVQRTGRDAAQAAQRRPRACQGNASDPLPKAMAAAAGPGPCQARPSRQRGTCRSADTLRRLASARDICDPPCQPRGKAVPVSVPEPSDVSFVRRGFGDKRFSLIYSTSVTVQHSITILETALQKNSTGEAGRTRRAVRRCRAGLPLPPAPIPRAVC